MNLTPTEKLYYQDQYLRNIATDILSVRQEKNGWQHAFVETIFYPGGGGQSPDEGLINNLKLRNLKEENGIIWHELDSQVTGQVSLELNWPLRIRRMQQHSGQHLVSAVFYRDYKINTVSVHLGQSDTLIEFDKSDIADQILEEAENKINAKIRENYFIRTHWVEKAKLNTFNLRRDILVESDPVRLVEIGDYDVTGCGGTHVASTSEIGLIKIIGTEKIRKHTRVNFRIGQAAYDFFKQLVTINQKLSHNLSSSYEDLEAKISKLIDEQKDLRRNLNTTRKNWLQLYAGQLISEERTGFFFFTDLSQTDLIDISLYWFEKFRKPCFFICKQADKYYFTMRSIEKSCQSAVSTIKSLSTDFGLRGGGTGDFAQGIIAKVHLDKRYLDDLKTVFNNQIFIKQVK